jgi:hypothetical protein
MNLVKLDPPANRFQASLRLMRIEALKKGYKPPFFAFVGKEAWDSFGILLPSHPLAADKLLYFGIEVHYNPNLPPHLIDFEPSSRGFRI